MPYEIVHTFIYDNKQVAELQARMLNELTKPTQLSTPTPLFTVREVQDASTKAT